MSQSTQVITDHLNTLAEDARALMIATAHVADDKVAEARKRLAAALESGSQALQQCKTKAMECGQVAEQKVRAYPFQTAGIALGVGVFLGLVMRHCCCQNEA